MTATTDRMATWVAEHGRYDAMLADYERALIDTATLAPGERVLDVGCGTGTTTLDAAAAVGPNGSVLGIDLSEVALARARERAAGIGNVFFEHGDVCEHPLGDAHFDVVISRFAVMLFAHPERAHRKLLRSLRPGGRFVATVWRERAVNAWMSLPMAAVAEHVAGLPEPAARTPCAFAFAEPARVRSVLGEAGFTDVTHARGGRVGRMGGTRRRRRDRVLRGRGGHVAARPVRAGDRVGDRGIAAQPPGGPRDRGRRAAAVLRVARHGAVRLRPVQPGPACRSGGRAQE
jgi:SAM-dependent methyltransferase